MIEKRLMNYSVNLYCRLVRVMADREFQEDPVFWNQYAFKYVFFDPVTKTDKMFSAKEAKKIWESYILLKFKCPAIDVKEVLQYLE